MRSAALVLLFLTALGARGEDGCKSPVRTTTRFRATVKAVEMIGARERRIYPVDVDMQYVVVLRIESVDRAGSPLRAGRTESFGIHSPSRTLGTEDVVGKKLDFEATWIACGGTFRRFEMLRAAPPARRRR